VSAKPRVPIESAGQRGSGTILVVDDEDVVRKIAKSTLERAGYTVLLAERGQAAIDLLKTAGEQVSLVLLDMTMPGLNGYETFLQLKRVRPTVKVLLSSGYNELEATRRFSGEGLAGFIQKPYTAGTLSKTVNSVLLSVDEHGQK
jgi:CheY-like chemotaxis protein